ncbi:MAG: phosphoglucosamine mutase [Actinomycetota bacterium]|nr:phosphoglucosamine mutase [Actinomycetota bacterium]
MARFGTDGVRGVANADLTPELALALGRATARVLGSPEFVIGRDTRRSGPLLASAVCAGLASEGADVVDLGVLPTPGVAYVSEARRLPAVMVSASHNPYEDNGIKLFNAGGMKISAELEGSIELEMEQLMREPAGGRSQRTGTGVGWISSDPSAGDAYGRHLRSVIGERRLDGLYVVLDCANGAASALAPEIFASSGARVTAISCDPDGVNINAGCGSTDPSALSAAVVAEGADLGLAFDGDADRLVAVDHTGTVADGDVLLALFAVDLAAQGNLDGGAVVVTVMTNLGFRQAMDQRGIGVRETPVGDRHVLAELDAEGLVLGGEQSGHIIFRRLATTGDGMLTGLLLADLVVRSASPLASLVSGLVTRLPQVMTNVPVQDPGRLSGASAVWKTVASIEEELGPLGRVLLRPSGTEPVVRVMVEAASEDLAAQAVRRLCRVVEGELGPVSG